MSVRTVCLGELLLRLSAPGRERLLQTPRLRVDVGGAEANVAVSLARLGHDVAMLSVLPSGPLGDAVEGELRRHGVDTAGVVRGPGRMGLYFLETGAVRRASRVVYDRAGSAFALGADALTLESALAGAQWLHVSGVTPALGPQGVAVARRAMRLARDAGLQVCFDGNFRAALWAGSGADPVPILRELFALADLLIVNHRDLGLALGGDFSRPEPDAALAAAAAAAFEAFPHLGRIACTLRVEHTVDRHGLSATLVTRQAVFQARRTEVEAIVDRIGTGDAFAAGLLHGLQAAMAPAECIAFALAAAVVKHSIPGDFNLAAEADIRQLMDDSGFAVRR